MEKQANLRASLSPTHGAYNHIGISYFASSGYRPCIQGTMSVISDNTPNPPPYPINNIKRITLAVEIREPEHPST